MAQIPLSKFAKALCEATVRLKNKPIPSEFSAVTVSRAASFLALVYEKIRNAIEYHEEHQIRRHAIERIVKRRFTLRQDAKGEGEALIRELMWARYVQNGTMGDEDIHQAQAIMDRFMVLRKTLSSQRLSSDYTTNWITDLVTAELEETLFPFESERDTNFTFFLYQTLREKIKLEDEPDQYRDIYLLAALEKAYRKSDEPSARYHLFKVFYKPLKTYSENELAAFALKLPEIFSRIDGILRAKETEKIAKFVKTQLPPYLILFELFLLHHKGTRDVLVDEEKLDMEVATICSAKYAQTRTRLRNLGIKSLIYIFATKMVLALILEYPISLWLFGEVHWLSIGINALFPPFIMVGILLLTQTPDRKNTQNILLRLKNIINEDPTYETQIAYLAKKPRRQNPALELLFTLLYGATFGITLYLIHLALLSLHFNWVSELIFVLFVSMISFFSFRISQVAHEYKLAERPSGFAPIVDFFAIPLLTMGKWLSFGVGRLNVFIIIFDVLIEAPLKLVIDIIEQWISFVRIKKEEIV